MTKELVFKRYQELLCNLHRFKSKLPDPDIGAYTCLLLGRCLGFAEALYASGMVDADELMRMQELAYSAHFYARRVGCLD